VTTPLPADTLESNRPAVVEPTHAAAAEPAAAAAMLEQVTRAFAYADPHLVLLSVLLGLWVLDRVFAAVAALRTDRGTADDSSTSA